MIRNYLPYKSYRILFGNRRDHLLLDEQDADWNNWKDFSEKFYLDTQKSGVGKIVNNSGYTILKNIDLASKSILELGPGNLPHYQYGKDIHAITL